jgi:hypothetical protein
MQNLSVKSMVMFYKSCRVFHKETNKTGFAFFWFLCEFLWNLQDSAKSINYLRFPFACRSLETFQPSQPCPRFAYNTLERSQDSQCGPWAMGAAAQSEFRWGARRTWPGEGRGRDKGLTYDRFDELEGPGRAPVMDGKEEAATRPPLPQFQRTWQQRVASRDSGGCVGVWRRG